MNESRINHDIKEILAYLITKLYPYHKKIIGNFLEKNLEIFNPCLYAKTICNDGRHRLFWCYIDGDNSCVQKKICLHCQSIIENETRIEHQFNISEWKYVADDTCEQRKACINDGILSEDKEHMRILHEKLSDWEYASNDSCEQRRKCSRCCTVETRIVHNYVYSNAGYSPGICSRCKIEDPDYHVCDLIPGRGTSDVCTICGQETNQYF